MTLLAVATLRLSLVLLCTLGAARLLRRQSASVRHAVLAAGVCCALLVMPLSVLLPHWSLPGGALIPESSESVRQPLTLDATTTETTSFEAIASSGTDTPAPAQRGWPLAQLVVTMWAVGAALVGAGVLGGLFRLRRLRTRGVRVTEGAWYELLQQKAEHDATLGRVALLRHDASMLATFGTLSPVILLPPDAEGWDRTRIAIVLEHELAHIRGRHALLQFAGQCLSTVCWFNPIVWAAVSRMRLESECVCDDEVLQSGVSGDDYAVELVALARSLTARRAWLPAPAMARPSSLERRVTAMLDPSVTRTPVSRVLQRAVIAASLALTASIASFAAQDTFARLSGTLHDQLGGTLPGATIALTHQQSGTKYEVKSNASGTFEFVGLQAGSYTMKLSSMGFETSEQSLQLTAGQVARRDATLALGTLQETISIVDGAPAATYNRPANAGTADAAACTAQPNSGSIKPPRKVRDVRPIFRRPAAREQKPEWNSAPSSTSTVRCAAPIRCLPPTANSRRRPPRRFASGASRQLC
ncbi:MAG: M56 family metallopeptidase [Vicinamibacterales bacterium]